MLDLVFQLAVFLKSFFTNTLLSEIVHQTKMYAEQCYQIQNKDSTWETSAEEIAEYLGITILIGINCRPDLYDYWSTSPKLHCFPITYLVEGFLRSRGICTLSTTALFLCHVLTIWRKSDQYWIASRIPITPIIIC